jgi:hypothetical protein
MRIICAAVAAEPGDFDLLFKIIFSPGIEVIHRALWEESLRTGSQMMF